MSAERWYVRERNRVSGPFTLAQLKAMLARGQLARFHDISTDQVAWKKASSLVELFAVPEWGGAGSATAPAAATTDALGERGGPDPAAEGATWYYASGRQRQGPVTRQELLMLVARGELRRDSLVWTEGMTAWTPAKLVPELDLGHSGSGVASGSRGRNWLIAAAVLLLLIGGGIGLTWHLRPDLFVASAVVPGAEPEGDPAPSAPESAVIAPAAAEPASLEPSPVAPAQEAPPKAEVVEDEPEPEAAASPAPAPLVVLQGKGGGLAIQSRADKRTEQAVVLIACGFSVIQRDNLQTDVVVSTGTGFLVTSDGYMLTNRHVVDGAHQLREKRVELERGRRKRQVDVRPEIWAFLGSKSACYEAKVVKIFDEENIDLAVLKIDAQGQPYFRIADGAARGEDISAMGFPGQAFKPVSKEEVLDRLKDDRKLLESIEGKGEFRVDMAFQPSDFDYSLTKGTISRVSVRNDVELLQHTAEIKPGNSGGPLVLEDGRVVGINTFFIADKKDVLEGRTFYALALARLRSSLAEVIPGWE